MIWFNRYIIRIIYNIGIYYLTLNINSKIVGKLIFEKKLLILDLVF